MVKFDIWQWEMLEIKSNLAWYIKTVMNAKYYSSPSEHFINFLTLHRKEVSHLSWHNSWLTLYTIFSEIV